VKSNKIIVLIIILLLISLSTSVILNLILFNRGKQYYFELNKVRLDPMGLNRYPISSQPDRDTNLIRVVFFGDSRAASWTSPEIEGYKFINRGIGSQTTIQNIQRFAAHVNPLKPDIIIIQVGVNDLKTIALFPEQKEAIIENCKSNLKQIVEASQQLGAVVILTTIFPVGEVPLERQPFWSDEVAEAINTVNTYLSTLATEDVIVLDTFPLLADSQGMLLSEYRADELHLNNQGYTILNQALIQLINQVQ
jgi:lysophospholipase L1-like esterase